LDTPALDTLAGNRREATMTQPEDFADPEERLRPEERDIEANDADAIEQATPADPALRRADLYARDEVGEYDAVEQSRVVELDDEYR
jgi:hypothetical protein